MSVEPGLERTVYGDGARETTTTRDSYVVTALNNLDKHVAELQEAVEVLFGRIEFVTQPAESRSEPGPVPYGADVTPEQPTSLATQRMREVSSALQRINRRVRDVTGRLDT